MTVSDLLLLGVGAPAAAGVAATVTFVTSAVDTSNATTYTFTSTSIGTAATGRRIVIGAGTADSDVNSIASVTVDGNAATLLVTGGASTLWPSALYIIQVDTGTAATIVVTFSNATFRCGIGVWAVYDLSSSTPTATASSTANPPTASINVSAGGVLIGYVVNESNAALSATWAGITERFDQTIESSGNPDAHTGASDAFATAQTGLSVTATLSSSFWGRSGCFAALR